MYDYLIIGAGLSGLVAAEQLTRRHHKRCLILEKRDHIAGNCYDYHDEHGVLIHKFGPHYFRTNSTRVLEYLSEFTDWIPANYRVLSKIGDQLYNFPINLNTFEQILGRASSEDEMRATLDEWKVHYDSPKNSEEAILSQVGEKLYNMFYKGYTQKQWQTSPDKLDPSVCTRIPIRTNRDDRYLIEKHQCMPSKGYTQLCQNLIDSCGENLTIRLEQDYFQLKKSGQLPSHRHTIYTGAIDQYFDYTLGRLPYRSLRFETEYISDVASESYHQPEMQINYPETHLPYTRTVEIKHATKQQIKGSTIVREYPVSNDDKNDPFYPIPTEETQQLYQKYANLADNECQTTFLGRLATYRYLNMDQVIAIALKQINKLF